MTRIGHWETVFGSHNSYNEPGGAWIDDDLKFSATLDVQSLVSDFLKGKGRRGAGADCGGLAAGKGLDC